jgi:hypothetical protein
MTFVQCDADASSPMAVGDRLTLYRTRYGLWHAWQQPGPDRRRWWERGFVSLAWLIP